MKPLAARIGLAGLLLLGVGPLLGVTRLWPGMPALAVAGLGGLLSFIALVAGIVGLLRRRGRPALVTTLLGLPAAALLVVWLTSRGGYPPINDVTTDPSDAPLLADAAPYPADFVAPLRSAYGDLQPLVLAHSTHHTFEAAVAEVEARTGDGWSLVTLDVRKGLMRGTAQSALFGFVDDWVIRVRPGAEGGAVVDIRSRSRDGVGDLGVNAARVRSLIAGLRERVTHTH